MFDTSKHYFAKGHLSPDADFVTTAEQDATYYYINAVPQWQAFNNGNWKVSDHSIKMQLMTYSESFIILQLIIIVESESGILVYIPFISLNKIVN